MCISTRAALSEGMARRLTRPHGPLQLQTCTTWPDRGACEGLVPCAEAGEGQAGAARAAADAEGAATTGPPAPVEAAGANEVLTPLLLPISRP
jgi:hypothetical protein